jgi:hypothetical protein
MIERIYSAAFRNQGSENFPHFEMQVLKKNFAEARRTQMSFGLLIYLNATRSGEGTAIFRRPKKLF